MKKQNIFTSLLVIIAVFLLGVWYGKTQAKPLQATQTRYTAQNYLALNDYDTIIKNDNDFFPHDTEKKDVPPELKDFLLHQEYPAYVTEKSCMKDTGTCTADNTDIQAEEVDLNMDGTNEFIVLPWKLCDCMVRGASGNGDILIVKSSTNTFEIIGRLHGNGYSVSKNKTNGYYDIVTNYHSSAASGTQTIYKFQPIVGDDTANGNYTEYLSKAYDFSRAKKQQ